MRLERKASVLALAMALGPMSAGPAFAQRKANVTQTKAAPAPAPPQDPDSARAQEHFQRARELYQGGSYREAISELEEAHKLDPTAKDLVLNLASVNEKAGQIDEALRWMSLYGNMDLDPTERQRAEATTRRLEGAKRDIEAHRPPPPTPQIQWKTPPPQPTTVQRGRIDVLTVSAAVIGLAGFGVGTYFGVRALDQRPGSNFVTGRDGSYADLVQRTDNAHRDAIYADIGFGVGVVGTVATLILYFARTKHSKSSTPVTVQHGRVMLGASF